MAVCSLIAATGRAGDHGEPGPVPAAADGPVPGVWGGRPLFPLATRNYTATRSLISNSWRLPVAIVHQRYRDGRVLDRPMDHPQPDD